MPGMLDDALQSELSSPAVRLPTPAERAQGLAALAIAQHRLGTEEATRASQEVRQ